MAGGIDWFRWHHGSVTDPKFQLVARKSKQALAAVIAVWAFLLERASESDVRGEFGAVDFESIDCLFGLDDGATQSILAAMADRGLVMDGCVCAWEKRQPKRERADSTNTDRSRAFRDRQRQALQGGEAQRQEEHEEAKADDATPCNATQRQKKPRGEERRVEEEYQEPNGSVGSADPPQQPSQSPAKPELPRCDAQAVVALYHEHLPELPAVRLMPDQRKRAVAAFWRFVLTSRRTDGQPRATTATEALAWIGNYFARVRENDFLMGRGERSGAHAKWQCDFDFLLTEKGKKHVIEKTQMVAA